MSAAFARLAAVFRSSANVARSLSYFSLWLSQLVSNFGDTLHCIPHVLLVFQITGRGATVAVLEAAGIAPIPRLAPGASGVIDSFSRNAVVSGRITKGAATDGR